MTKLQDAGAFAKQAEPAPDKTEKEDLNASKNAGTKTK
jgi:hypothetical protein